MSDLSAKKVRDVKIYITNLGKYVEGYLIGKWVQLPIDEDDLEKVLEAIGIDDYYEEFFISDYETEIVGVGNSIGEYSSLVELNKLAERLESLCQYDADKLEAMLEYTSCRGVTELLELIDELDDFDLLPDVDDDEALGYYYADECCCIDIPEHIRSYFDFESYGRDIRLESNIIYTTYGCVIDNR